MIFRRNVKLKKSKKPYALGEKQRPDLDLAQKTTLQMIYLIL